MAKKKPMTKHNDREETRTAPAMRWRRGLGFRVLIRILVFSSVVTVLLTAVQLYVDFRSDVERLEERLRQVAQSYSLSLAESLWSLDERQLRLQANGILNLPEVRAVEIRELDPFGVPLIVSVGTTKEERFLAQETPITCACDGAEQNIGILRIEASLTAVYSTLFDRFLVILVSIGAKAFLVSLFAYYVMHRMVTRHLRDLANATDQIEAGLGSTTFRLDRQALAEPDELDQVVSAFNRWGNRLGQAMMRLKDANELLERQQAGLERSDRFHRELIDALPVAVFMLDADARLVMFNAEAKAITGRDPELGVPFGGSGAQLLWPDGRSVSLEERPSMIALREGRPLRGVETVIHRADGRKVHGLNYPTPLLDDDGNITGVINVYVDVTALKEVETELRETSARLAATIDNLPGVAYRAVFTPTGRRMVYISEACRAFLGLSPEEVCALSHGELNELFLMYEGALSIEGAYRSLLETGRFEVTRQVRGADGERFWAHFRGRVTERRGDELLVDGLFVDVTTEMQAKQAQQRGEQRYRQLIECLPIPIFVLDAQARLEFYNEAGATLLGRHPTVGAIYGGAPAPLYLPDGTPIPMDQRPATIVAREGKPLREVEVQIGRPDGTRASALAYPTPLFDGDGRVSGVLSVFVDVTRLKAIEEVLRETSMRLTATIDNLPGVAFRSIYTPTERRVIYASEATRHFNGLSPEELCGMSHEQVSSQFHPDDYDYDAAYRALVGTGKIARTLRMRRGNDAWFWANFRGRVVERSGDKLTVEGLFVDVTAEIDAKRALERNERRYRNLFEAMPVGVYEDDLVTGNVYVNEAWIRLSGRDRAELTGEGWMESIHPDDRAAAVGRWRDITAKGIGGISEFRLVRPDGTIVWVLTEAVPQHGTDGQLIGYIGTATDLTERHRIEAERRQIEQKLQAGQHMEALGQLASGIAHDFNNLLGAIKGFARFIIEDAEPGSSASHHAHRILAAGQRARALVGQILAVGRRGEIDRCDIVLAVLVTETMNLLRASIPASTRILGPTSGYDLVVSADADHLGQALLNLCINAHDALKGRSGTIGIEIRDPDLDADTLRRLTSRSADGAAAAVEAWSDSHGTAYAVTGAVAPSVRYVSLVVTDTGTGMTPQLLEQIFTPFFTTKERGRGTGLGLVSVQNTVLALGGAIVVVSRPGGGTRFEVLLPRGSAATLDTSSSLPSFQGHAAGGRVLLVDDDPDFGDMLQLALERRGFEVAPCADPLEALEGFRSAPEVWDAVVTDQTMPNMSGLDLIREIKAVREDVPCVMCSGYAEGLTQQDLASAGVLSLLPKPVNIDDLVSTLAQAIAARTSPSSTDAEGVDEPT